MPTFIKDGTILNILFRELWQFWVLRKAEMVLHYIKVSRSYFPRIQDARVISLSDGPSYKPKFPPICI